MQFFFLNYKFRPHVKDPLFIGKFHFCFSPEDPSFLVIVASPNASLSLKIRALHLRLFFFFFYASAPLPQPGPASAVLLSRKFLGGFRPGQVVGMDHFFTSKLLKVLDWPIGILLLWSAVYQLPRPSTCVGAVPGPGGGGTQVWFW